MSNATLTEPRFPLRLIYDDGQSELIDSPEQLLEQVDTIDTTLDRNHVWVRDELGRTVHLRMTGGEVQLIEVVE